MKKRSYLPKPITEQEKDYFQAYSAGTPPLSLPFDYVVMSEARYKFETE